MPEPRRIKPFVQELSLAFNPANQRKFIMHKDDGGGFMKSVIAFLQKDDPAEKEQEFMKFLKDQGYENQEIGTAIYRLVASEKESFPENFTAALAKELLGIEAGPDAEQLKKDLEKELRETLSKEIRMEVEKEMKMTKDEEVKTLSDKVEALTKDLADTNTILATSNENLEKERDARRLSELRKDIDDAKVPGDHAKLAKMAMQAEKLDPAFAKDFQAYLKETGTAFETASIFNEGINPFQKEKGSAGEEMDDMVKAAMEKDGELSKAAAMAKVAKENPKLYAKYNEEHHRRNATQ